MATDEVTKLRRKLKEGSVTEIKRTYKNGSTKSTWKVWCSLGFDNQGKRIRKSQGGFKSELAALREAPKLVNKWKNGGISSTEESTFGEYLLEWIGNRPVNEDFSPTTKQTYEDYIRNRIVPNVGHLKVNKIRSTHLDQMYSDLNGELRGSSIRQVHAIVRKALQDAVDNEIIDIDNPAKKCKNVPKQKSIRSKQIASVKTWDWDECMQFLETIKDHDLYALFWLAVWTGLRRGELVGIKNCDITGDYLTVNNNIVEAHNSEGKKVLIPKAPKSGLYGSQIALDRKTVNVLARHKKQHEEKLRLLGVTNQNDSLFTDIEGGWIRPGLVSETWRRLVAKSGLPKIRLHDLRHSHLTALSLAGTLPLKTISERARHSNVSFTQERYVARGDRARQNPIVEMIELYHLQRDSNITEK